MSRRSFPCPVVPPFVCWVFLAVLAWLAAAPCDAQVRQSRSRFSTSSTAVGYIDTAYVGDMFRFRFDAGYGNDVPDRAEFFYAKCGCFRPVDPNAPGPPLPESNVDFQTLQADLQYELTDGFAILAEFPVRLLNPELNDNTGGLGDIQAGIKLALNECEHQTLTFQLRTYIPTGDADRGLGTDHASLEPALLYYRSLSDRVTLEAELREWIPLGGASTAGTPFVEEKFFSGDILRYGVGLGYTVHEDELRRITPVVEFVGWTLFDGLASTTTDIFETDGDTIFNIKVGLRVASAGSRSLYAGYGVGVTGDVWYDDIFRFEYRLTF